MGQMFGDSLSKILGLILIVVVLPIFAGLGMLSAGASAGLISMGDIITQFMPIFGIGAESNYSNTCTSFSLLAGFGLLRRNG